MGSELVKIFKEVRDIPYKLRLSVDEEDYSCDGKHKKLAELLMVQGYNVRWQMCLYKWEALPIPKYILKLKPSEFYYHSFLEIQIGKNWIKLDATWDRGLASVLPFNEWNGQSDTKIGVPCIEILSPEKSLEVINKPRNKEEINKSLEKNRKFYEALNKWFDEIRKEI